MKKKLALALAALMAMSATGCSSSSSSTDADGNPSLSIATHPYVHALPNIYAIEQGLLDGFELETSTYADGTSQNEAIASDSWEVGTTGLAGALLGAAGYDLHIIGFTASETETTNLWVRPDSALAQAVQDEDGIYGTAEDWAGLEILCPTGTGCQMVLIATLERMGLQQSDVSVIDMAVASSYPAFKAGEADVVALWSPFGIYAEREGWICVSSAGQLGIDIPSAIVATEKAVEERPEVVQEWFQAYMDASEVLSADLDLASELIYDYQKSEGISVDEESARQDTEDRPIATKEEIKEWFAEDEDGGSYAQDTLIVFADFLISQGKLTEEDKERIIENGCVDGTFIANVS